jgi:putative tricarboxylic transport membrane protein
MSEKNKRLFSSILVLSFALIVFIGSLNMRTLLASLTGPEYVPRIVASLLLVLGLFLLASAVKNYRSDDSDEGKREDEHDTFLDKYIVNVTLVLFFLYVLFLKRLGFVISTVLYVTLQIDVFSRSFNIKKTIVYLVFAIPFSLLIFYIFSKFFNVVLPRGVLRFL